MTIATVGSPFPPSTAPSAIWGRHSPIYPFSSGTSSNLLLACLDESGRTPSDLNEQLAWRCDKRRTALSAAMHDDHLGLGLEPPVPAPLGRTPETRNASSDVPRRRPESLASSDSCYSPRQSRVALPRVGGTFSPPAPPPPFAPPPPDASPGFAAERSSRVGALSSADNPNHLISRKPLSPVAARCSGPTPSNHNPEPAPLSTSARPESYLTGSSRYSDSSGLGSRYVCFLNPQGRRVACFELATRLPTRICWRSNR